MSVQNQDSFVPFLPELLTMKVPGIHAYDIRGEYCHAKVISLRHSSLLRFLLPSGIFCSPKCRSRGACISTEEFMRFLLAADLACQSLWQYLIFAHYLCHQRCHSLHMQPQHAYAFNRQQARVRGNTGALTWNDLSSGDKKSYFWGHL